MSEGKITQVIGAVIDVEFSKDELPKVYDALFVEENDLVLEVQQQLGDGVVRTIAMGTTEGLKRGTAAKNTGAPVSVPVGEETLGRIMNVLGEPIWARRTISWSTSVRNSVHIHVISVEPKIDNSRVRA